jgi:hypothetical protein
MSTTAAFQIIRDDKLVKRAASSVQGRKFWTGGRIEDAQEHLTLHPHDVCMVRYQDDCDKTKIVLLGGSIEKHVLLDVTDYDFSGAADSFDVGEMTSFVEQWFQKDFDKQGMKVFLFWFGLFSALVQPVRETHIYTTVTC